VIIKIILESWTITIIIIIIEFLIFKIKIKDEIIVKVAIIKIIKLE